MNILNFKIIPQVSENLSFILKNKVKKAEFEEKIKLELLRVRQELNPDDFDINLKFNKTANTYDLTIVKIK